MGIRPDGRWGGQVTSRALPDDPSIALLSVEDRRTIAEVWIGRAASERRVATSFELIHDALAGLGAAPELLRLADRAVDDEHRHAELCRLVASRFAGHELAPPALLPHGYPQHPSASESLRRTLWVVGHCLLNETTASAFLEVTLEHATGALARAACRELLSDEIDHARLGWWASSPPRSTATGRSCCGSCSSRSPCSPRCGPSTCCAAHGGVWSAPAISGDDTRPSSSSFNRVQTS